MTTNPSTTTPNYALSVDPGGQHTAVVLARLDGDGWRPIDGSTIDRLDSEHDGDHSGSVRYARRCLTLIGEMLDKHAVADSDLDVYVETLTVPKPVKPGTSVVPMAIWRPMLGTSVVLGAIAAVYDAVLVAPDGHDRKLAASYPPQMKGHTPAGWTKGGISRHHQAACWSILVSGLRQRADRPTMIAPFSDSVQRSPRASAASRLVTAGVAALTDTSRVGLLRAAREVQPAGASPAETVALAVEIAVAVRPDTPREALAKNLANQLQLLPA